MREKGFLVGSRTLVKGPLVTSSMEKKVVEGEKGGWCC